MNRRSFLQKIGFTTLGSSAGFWAGHKHGETAVAQNHDIFLPLVANGSANGPGSLLVAAADAPSVIKNAAHYQCDGVNDQIEINQAIADLGAVGGLVQLSEGTFHCAGSVRLTRRTALCGKGRATILKAIGTWVAHDGTPQGGVIEPSDGGVDKTAVSHLAIDGNRYQGADVRGIYYNITSKDNFDEGPDAGHQFTGLYIFHTRRHGFHINGSFMRATKANRIRVYNPGQEGVTEAHGFYIQSPDGFFSQCECGSSSGSGFYVDGTNNHFTTCKSWYSDLSGWQIKQPRGQYASCEAQDNQEHGFYITTGPNSLTSCHADSNSWDSINPAANFDGFQIPWGNRIQLVGCSAYDKNEGGRGNWQRYGFFVGSSAEHCQIMGTVSNNITSAVGGSGVGSASNLIMVNG